MAKVKAKETAASDGRLQALEAAIGQLDKAFGKGTVMKLGDAVSTIGVEAMPTGVLSLDIALGVGGIPRGRIVEIYGPEAGGKTTLALHMAAEAQRLGGIAGFIDVEHALDPLYAQSIGVDIDNLYVSQPDSGEQALTVAETMARSGAVDIVIVDSVAALTPQAEIDGDMGDAHVGLLARLMSQGMRKLASVVAKSRCTIVFINQLREKVGIMFGNPETTPGGKALKYYASVRLDIRRVDSIKAGGHIIGNRVRVKTVKNKVAPPFREAVFDIIFGKGASRAGDVLDLATSIGVVQKSGNWYAFNGEKIGNGREAAKVRLEGEPDLLDTLERLVRENHPVLNQGGVLNAQPSDEQTFREGPDSMDDMVDDALAAALPDAPEDFDASET